IRLSFLLSFSENPVSGLKLPGAGTLTMSVVSSTITQPDASIIFSNGLLPFAANFTKRKIRAAITMPVIQQAVWSAAEDAAFPGGQTLAQALSGKHYGKIYMMLGINELGTGSAERWAAQYKVLLEQVRSLQPDAIVFLQAIFHTTQEKSDSTFYTNSTINARNAELQKLADGVNVFFIDCNPIFDDAGGALRADYSGDGVHVKAAYYPLWRDYLFRFGVVR
ncbi:MAG: hypothetical protein EGQ07_02645, partial [Clostridiales bacterium]|nr:hypothetical protein [Clostridiales bacterium]